MKAGTTPRGFIIMALLMMSAALSSLLWIAVYSWYAVLSQNRADLAELQLRADAIGIIRTSPPSE